VPASSARLLVDLALATLVGGFVFVALVWPDAAGLRGTRQLLAAAAVTAAAATVALAIVQRDTAAVDWAELLQLHIGKTAVARLALLLLAALPIVGLARGGAATARSAWWRVGATAISLGLLETIVVAGHEGRATGVDATARLVHTIGLSVWLGGLLMLFVVVLPRRRSEELNAVLPRFSMLATGAVIVLVLAGILLSIDLVGAAGALPGTTYGRILLTKLAAVAVLLGAATRSRAEVRHRLRGAASAAPIATWVGIELALVAVVFVLTALLVSHAPPA
jgi:putative copper export protein